MASRVIERPLLRCQTADGLGHALLGYHDAIDSWTVNVAHDTEGTHQTFVSHHEAAHHRLHSATPWGLAVLVAGVPDAERAVAADRWLELLAACRVTHEVYATWAAAEQTPAADELLRGNLLYSSYLRDARYLGAAISSSSTVAGRGVDLLLRLVMAPARLAAADVRSLRSRDPGLLREDHPDHRLGRLLEIIEGSALQAVLVETLDVAPTAPLDLDGVIAQLERAGLPTMTFAAQREWTEAIVDELEREHPGRYVIEEVTDRGDLTGALDDQQRERIQMHTEPLPLEVLAADADGRFDVQTFVRTSEGVGKHVWLTWLHPAFLTRQFVSEHALGSDPVLGLLSCDRVHGPAHASWFPFPEMPAGLAARAVTSGDTTPLLFTTLRTLEATADDIDFRGFEPAFVLIDSDVVAFLQRSLERGGLKWSVIGAAGSRTIDVLIFEQLAITGIYYVYVCSAPTGRLTAAWLQSREPSCPPDSAAFEAIKPLAWALVEHLLGTLWMFDLHGYGDQ